DGGVGGGGGGGGGGGWGVKRERAGGGGRNSGPAWEMKSARIPAPRRSGVRSWNASSSRPGLESAPADRIGVTIASYQRSTGTRWKNSARWDVPLARAWRIASNTSGTRSPSETDSPGSSAGATEVARALRRGGQRRRRAGRARARDPAGRPTPLRPAGRRYAARAARLAAETPASFRRSRSRSGPPPR